MDLVTMPDLVICELFPVSIRVVVRVRLEARRRATTYSVALRPEFSAGAEFSAAETRMRISDPSKGK